jgi:hypothetical protein
LTVIDRDLPLVTFSWGTDGVHVDLELLHAAVSASGEQPFIATNRRALVLQFAASAAVLIVVERATHHGAVCVQDE